MERWVVWSLLAHNLRQISRSVASSVERTWRNTGVVVLEYLLWPEDPRVDSHLIEAAREVTEDAATRGRRIASAQAKRKCSGDREDGIRPIERARGWRTLPMYAILIDVYARGRNGIHVSGLVDRDHVDPRACHQLVLKVRARSLTPRWVPDISRDAVRPARRVLAVKTESPFALARSRYAFTEPVDINV